MEPLQLLELSGEAISTETAPLDLLQDVRLDVRIDLGRTYLRYDVLRELDEGTIVPLDKSADEPVDVFVGNRLVARGQIVVLDEKYCVRITELVAGVAAA